MGNTSVARKKQMDKGAYSLEGVESLIVESRILGNTHHGKESI
jgi:hypothetical protein